MRCRAVEVDDSVADMIGTWFRLGLHDRAARHQLTRLPLEYSDMCDAWDAEQGRLAKKRRERDAAVELLRQHGLRK